MEMAIVAAVILARLLVPLLIFKYPLPAILACLVIDAADQSIFQAVVPDADLSGYQSYDKALDIYYLTLAYISTLRNWTSQFAVSIVRFLLYYRLVGVVLFELTQERWFLFIFPNTFEYVFIFYEAVRVRWDPTRMSKRLLLGATAFIWIVIKLPQEWWIHIAQLDTTDLVQEQIFGVPAGTSWVDTFAQRPYVLVVFARRRGARSAVLAWWVFANVLPAPDRPITLRADDEDGREPRPTRLMEVRNQLATAPVRPAAAGEGRAGRPRQRDLRPDAGRGREPRGGGHRSRRGHHGERGHHGPADPPRPPLDHGPGPVHARAAAERRRSTPRSWAARRCSASRSAWTARRSSCC